MAIGSDRARWDGTVRLLKGLGLAILILVPGYHFLWHLPADLPPDVLEGLAESLPGEADMATLRSQATPLSYVATVDSADRRDVRYRVVYSKGSGEYSVTTTIGDLELGRVLSWIMSFALVCYVVQRLFFTVVPRVVSPKCPSCRLILQREDTQLMGSRRIGELSTPVVMKATHGCSCGYQRNKVYTWQEGSSVLMDRGPMRFGPVEGQITEDEWDKEVERLKKEHDTPGNS